VGVALPARATSPQHSAPPARSNVVEVSEGSTSARAAAAFGWRGGSPSDGRLARERRYALPVVPPPFQTLRALRTLNIAAVACAMASLTAVAFSYLLRPLGHESSPGEVVALVTGASTALLGALWAWVLRSPKTVALRKVRWGWILSLPLASLNAALACDLLLAYEAALSTGTAVAPSSGSGTVAAPRSCRSCAAVSRPPFRAARVRRARPACRRRGGPGLRRDALHPPRPRRR
jgi:hypothetical protein